MKKFIIFSLLVVITTLSCFCFNEGLKDSAEKYEINLIGYAETGFWQYNNVPLSVPEGENPDEYEVEPDEALGKSDYTLIDYYCSLDDSKLYQIYKTDSGVYVAEYDSDGNITLVDGWRFK